MELPVALTLEVVSRNHYNPRTMRDYGTAKRLHPRTMRGVGVKELMMKMIFQVSKKNWKCTDVTTHTHTQRERIWEEKEEWEENLRLGYCSITFMIIATGKQEIPEL
ncbi:hypothetical protein ElyMa_005339100 [Elysia marginata]|uniref:Uncharacterized protein n=1 Tax=Elysia marginata TaxID=1093978 RepID=A0AAV4E9Y9_9GAST|nr:hypothetical protein ElyMa_005339100 [Elysia marginata]